MSGCLSWQPQLQNRLRHACNVTNRNHFTTETLTKKNERNKTATIFSFNKRTRIGTWNIRTLYDAPSKLEDLVKEFKKVRLDVLGICEHRWADKGKISIPGGTEQLTFLFSGRPLSEKRESGVGLLLSASAGRALIDWSPVSDRILVARFRTRARNVSIIQVYSPTNMADTCSKDNFYELLSATLSNTPRGDIQILMGDLNAKVGSDNSNREFVMGRHGIGTANDNGERFVELCTSHGLVIGGTVFIHKDIHKVTWHSNDGITQNQIDHISISHKWRGSLMDVRVFRGAEVHTDHKLLVATLKIRLAADKPRFANHTRRVDPLKLQIPQCREKFRKALEQQLNITAPTDPEQHWEHLRKACINASESTIPLAHERKKCYISDSTWSIIEQRKQAKQACDVARSQQQRLEALGRYNALDRQVKHSARQDRRTWLNSIADQAQDAANKQQSRELYRLTKRLAGQSRPADKPVKSVDGTPLTNADLQMNRWTEHFKSVLNPPSTSTHRDFLDNVQIPELTTNIDTTRPSVSE
ncbi:uncharacterized protein, partial [Chironomus tepperi]|uniref:uncharacterized protein n=1 Tax=Chironomus tepperi TaxID=113505 RepID=UPI00391F8A79